jgi:putative replication protein
MSVRATNWAWSLEEVMGSEALVLLALADQANDEGFCWPAQEKLAPKARQSVSTLRRSLRSLEKMGLLTTITRSSTRGRRSNLYLLHIGAKPDLSMRSAKAVSLGEDAAQACQMLEEASDAVFVANKPTGQIDRLPQPVTDDRLQPVTSDRLLYTEPPLGTTRPYPTLPTAPAPDQAASAKVGSGGKTSTQGTKGTRNAPVEGPGVPVGEVKPRPGSRVQAGSFKGPRTAEVGLSEQERALVGACLPAWMSALDKRGAHKVAQALKERVDAGWQPSQIRGLLDGNPPSQVIHMASLVLNRLERNVDIDCAPARLNAEAKKRASERRQIIDQREREREVPLDAKAQAAANAAKEWVAKNYPALGGMDMALAAVCYQKNSLGEQLSGFEKNRLAKIGVTLPTVG